MFLDFDGTISKIAATPTEARIDPRIKRLLERLAEDTEVAIVSGRGLDDLKRKVEIDAISYVGAHGLQLAMHGREREEPFDLSAEKREIAALERRLQTLFGKIQGVVIENKTVCMALHYRQRPDLANTVLAIVGELVRACRSLKLTRSKMAVEVRPKAHWDKGSAVDWLIRNNRQFARLDRFPLYIGDDVTDQDAFRAIRHNGIGIYVGAPEMCGHAEFFVEDVESVHELLCLMAEEFFPRSIGRMPACHSEIWICRE